VCGHPGVLPPFSCRGGLSPPPPPFTRCGTVSRAVELETVESEYRRHVAQTMVFELIVRRVLTQTVPSLRLMVLQDFPRPDLRLRSGVKKSLIYVSTRLGRENAKFFHFR